MRRVRDEIGAEQDHDNGGDRGGGEGGGQHVRKEKKKKRSDRHRDKERRMHRTTTANDSISEVGSEGHQRSMEGRHYNNQGGPHAGHHPQSTHPYIDGESEAMGSTAQNSSMDGNGSVVSDPYIPRYQQPHHGHGGRDAYYQQHPHTHHQHPQQQQYHDPHQQQQQAPPPPQRTMVLSMAFTDRPAGYVHRPGQLHQSQAGREGHCLLF